MTGPPEGSLSVIVPVYGGEATLQELCDRIKSTLSQLTNNFEIIFVNDGSPDGSWKIICDLASSAHWVRGIDLSRNYGQHNALLVGIRAARFETIVTLDDDLQHPPEAIPAMVAALREGNDVIYGVPIERQHDRWRSAGSQLIKLALRRAMPRGIARTVGPFRAFRANISDAFAMFNDSAVSIDVLLTWGATRFASIPIQHGPRREGRSTYSVAKLLELAITMVTGFSTFPLRLASVTGFLFALFGVGLLGYVVTRFLISGSIVPGFPFLASVISIFSGVQLFALGVIGEYLARMHWRSMGRPYAVIRESVGPETEETAAGS
jgi:undecaprenyl-phosphate 4-deoxy-4-formamido-L-arabinose transferase